MSSPPPLISNHRLARLALWLLGLLLWFALGGQGGDRQRRRANISFDKIERAVRNLILIRAAQLLAALRAWRELAAALARRRSAGLTRLVRTRFASGRAIPLLAPAAISAHAADTS